MNTEEFKNLVKKNDEKRGHIDWTLQFLEKREKKLSALPDIIIKVVQYLHENNIGFMICETVSDSDHYNVRADIYIPKYNIVVRHVRDTNTSRNNSQQFHNQVKGRCYPVYARWNEDIDFVIEKITNTIYTASEKPKKFSPNIVGAKPKRTRIKAVRC